MRACGERTSCAHIQGTFDAQVIERLGPIVDTALRRVIGADDPEFDDVLQSVFERLLGTVHHDSFRGECSIAGWALAITRNVAIDRLRARSRERHVFAREGVASTGEHRSADPGPERIADLRQQLARFAGALSRLGAAKAEVVYLHDVLGHDLTQVADMLGISVAAAQSRLVRARREIAARTRPGGSRTS